MDSASLAKVIRRVDDWKLKLIDLSKRNRLIHFRPTRSSNIAFQRPGIDTIFERLVVKDRAWEIWQLKEEYLRDKAEQIAQLDPKRAEILIQHASQLNQKVVQKKSNMLRSMVHSNQILPRANPTDRPQTLAQLDRAMHKKKLLEKERNSFVKSSRRSAARSRLPPARVTGPPRTGAPPRPRRPPAPAEE